MLLKRISEAKDINPKFAAAIACCKFVYVCDDGVMMIPIGCLR